MAKHRKPGLPSMRYRRRAAKWTIVQARLNAMLSGLEFRGRRNGIG